MKYFYSFLLSFALFSFSYAQGVYQLWGTTTAGGPDDQGSIFSVNTSGDSFHIRKQIIRNHGLGTIYSSLTELNGKYYGVTGSDGANNAGTIFEWDPVTNAFTKKYDLIAAEGTSVYHSMQAYNGKLYGVASSGGTGIGVIFEFDPVTNIYTKKIDLTSTTGFYPYGELALYNGKFYGTTASGGGNGQGVIFEWDPVTNIYSKKIDFLSAVTGFTPNSGMTFYNGKFYGVTNGGGDNGYGTFYEWDPVTNICLKKFSLNSAFHYSDAKMTLYNGKFYTVFSQGGSAGYGLIYVVDFVNGTSSAISFTTPVGLQPRGGLTVYNGKLYGLAPAGGANNQGTIYEVDPVTNTIVTKIDMDLPTGSQGKSEMVLLGNKFYGISGGSNLDYNGGLIFEWDPSSNIYTRKTLLMGTKGGNPRGKLIKAGGKFYGVAYTGGLSQQGTIFEWDPNTKLFSEKITMETTTGASPVGELVPFNGKFYGLTKYGGTNNLGVIFEWDTLTNTYTKKFDFSTVDGNTPYGSMTAYNNKLYGMTYLGGTNNLGVIFEFDPATNTYTKKLDLDNSGLMPKGSLLLYNGKFYGTTTGGGGNYGCIFEWDPATNIFTTKASFDYYGRKTQSTLSYFNGKMYGTSPGAVPDGFFDGGQLFEFDLSTNTLSIKHYFQSGVDATPVEDLTLSGGRFYGYTANGGSLDKGVLFEWDPATNLYNIKKEFVAGEGASADRGNGFIYAPGPIASSARGVCNNIPPVTIDNTNNTSWVPIVDSLGDVVAEIRANGNNLGIINTAMYLNAGFVREDGHHKMYADRTLTITPQTQPSSSVDIRLYLQRSEFEILRDAHNSLGQSSGIMGINDIAIFKNSDGCGSPVVTYAAQVASTSAAWDADYVISASINGFSTFYFASKTIAALPITLLEFNGNLVHDNAVLNWKTENEQDAVNFIVERSIDGYHFNTAGNVDATNTQETHLYTFTDPAISRFGKTVIYYRLRQNSIDGRFVYSEIVPLSINNNDHVSIYPNPVVNMINLTVTVKNPTQLNGRITDNAGRLIRSYIWNISAGVTSFGVDAKALPAGSYYLEVSGGTVNERKRFVKN